MCIVTFEVSSGSVNTVRVIMASRQVRGSRTGAGNLVLVERETCGCQTYRFYVTVTF